MKDFESIALEIRRERIRQDDLWGEQNHSQRLEYLSPLWMSSWTTVDQVKAAVEVRFENGHQSWDDILFEEVAEAMEPGIKHRNRRAELIQVAAVAIAMIQSLDRVGMEGE